MIGGRSEAGRRIGNCDACRSRAAGEACRLRRRKGSTPNFLENGNRFGDRPMPELPAIFASANILAHAPLKSEKPARRHSGQGGKAVEPVLISDRHRGGES